MAAPFNPPPHINDMPKSPSSSSPTHSLFSFHRSRLQDRPIPHYRAFSVTQVHKAPSVPSRGSIAFRNASKQTHRPSISVPPSLAMDPEDSKMSPQKSQSTLSAKLKKSTRHLKQLFIDPGSQQALSLQPALPFPPLDSYDDVPNSSDEDYGSVLITSSSLKEVSYAAKPLLKRSGSDVHPYGTGAAYLQSYNNLDSERYNHLLLQRINPHGGPAFHQYTSPPKDVLDLGSGACHWPVYAARYWKESIVTAFDMVDVKCPSLPMPPNFQFVRGNFVMYKLPFEDESFDMVRMSDLSLCIPIDRWNHVLEECYRVLRPEGRLEILHNKLFFPHAQPPRTPDFLSFDRQRPGSFSSAETGLDSLMDSSRGSVETSITDYDALSIQEEKEATVTRGENAERPLCSSPPSRPLPSLPLDAGRERIDLRDPPEAEVEPEASMLPFSGMSYTPLLTWKDRYAESQWLEDAYVNMLQQGHDIYAGPRPFLRGKLERVFKHTIDPSKFTLKLAPEYFNTQRIARFLCAADFRKAGRTSPNLKKDKAAYEEQIANKLGIAISDLPSTPPLSSCPGLVLSMSSEQENNAFLPMSAQELEFHASHHLHKLLSSKHALYTYISTLPRKDGTPCLSPAQFADIIFDYECFRRERLQWPSALPELSFDIDEDDDMSIPRRSNDSSTSSEESSSSNSHPDILPTQLSSSSLDHINSIREIEVFVGYKCTVL